jgi:hypothetical protein
MDIHEVKKTVDLLKKANGCSYVTLTELSKELKTTKTKLMEFIENNNRLFILKHKWTTKDKTVITTFAGRKYKDTIQVKAKDLGLCVENVFLQLDENYNNIEWAEKMKITHEKYLNITPSNNYGYIQGYYVELDKEDETYRKHLWRNTKEKIEKIKDYLSSGYFVYGGLGDSYSTKHDNIITTENIEKLKKEGWTFNDYPPLSK